MTDDPPDDETPPDEGPPDDEESADSTPPEDGGADDSSSPEERDTDDTPPESGDSEDTDGALSPEGGESDDADPSEAADRSDSTALFGTPEDDAESESGADDTEDVPAATTGRDEPTVPTEAGPTDGSSAESGPTDGPSTEDEAADGAVESEERATSAVPDAGSRSRVESALTDVRRECWKAATVHAVTEAAVVFLAANLVLVTLAPPWLPERVPLPESVSEQLVDLVGGSGSLAVPGSAALAVALGVVAFLVGVGVRVRRPLVEQFEAANPPVREALRTARDAVGDEADSAMARRLYADVLDRLGESSGLALVDGRRIGLTVVVAVVLAVATVQVAVLDPGLFEPPIESNEGGPGEPQNNYTGLLDGDQILGDSEAVEAGDDELNASIESSGGGQDVGEQQQFPSDGGPGANTGNGGVDSQQAGFAAPDQVEDAELVREYNRRIRSGDAAGRGSGDGGDGGSAGGGSGGDSGGGSDSNQNVDGDNT